MNYELPERPAAGKRRAPRPAPDVNVDPVDSSPDLGAKNHSAKPFTPPQKIVRVPFSNRLSENTMDTLARVKAEMKIPIYEAIEMAVAEKWAEFERNK
ncbi:hypothetical protein [Glutamicibacter ardleyensis]|uniref:hypothetical protein n=1 Tax=Glutamicibacter ardleyensis TaxID=225894 RepID=UPI003FD3B92A